jgi:hypothetical protein
MRTKGVIGATLAGCLVAGALFASPAWGTSAPKTSTARTELGARLDGDKEVPGPGDPNGKGRALIFINVKKRRVCFDVTWKRIQGPLQANIHRGGPDIAGPVKVTLFAVSDPLPSPSGFADGCVEQVKKKLLRKIKNNPRNYYVNVHNENYPDGAIRGQLRLKERVAKKGLIARLTGEKEVPGPGDRNGRGRALVFPNVKKRRVCFTLRWTKIQGPLQAHIHRGGPNVAGPVKVTLFAVEEPLPGPSGDVEGCIKDLKRKLVRKIKNNPRKYYVNVHNENYPDGAIRGQLNYR